jgi:hypothetical protein
VKMGPTRCPETSVNNYLTTPCNHPKDHRLQVKLGSWILYGLDFHILVQDIDFFTISAERNDFYCMFYSWITNIQMSVCKSRISQIKTNSFQWPSFRFIDINVKTAGTRWLIWLRHCATSRKLVGSIPDGVIKIFYWPNPAGCTMALGSTQPLKEMSTRSTS